MSSYYIPTQYQSVVEGGAEDAKGNSSRSTTMTMAHTERERKQFTKEKKPIKYAKTRLSAVRSQYEVLARSVHFSKYLV